MRPFDWKKICPDDVARRCYPAVVGRGRGVPLSHKTNVRKLRDRRLTREAAAT